MSNNKFNYWTSTFVFMHFVICSFIEKEQINFVFLGFWEVKLAKCVQHMSSLNQMCCLNQS